MKFKIPQFADKVRKRVNSAAIKAKTETGNMASILKDKRGEQNLSMAGLIVIGLIVIAAIIVWVNAKSPGFFSKLGDKILDVLGL